MQNSNENISTQRWVVAVAVILFFLKLAAYYLTQSVAVLTDALESTVNVIAGSIGLYSLHVAAKPRDQDHPYGHGKAEFLSAAVEGALVLMAGLIIIYEAIVGFLHPHPIQRLDRGMYIIGFTAAVNYLVGYICIYRGRKNNSMALLAGGRHLQTDTYSTTGIIIGLLIIWFTKLSWLDGVVSIIFAGIILYTGYHILRSSIAGIMDEADMKLLQDLITYINSHRRSNWIDLHNLRVIKYGGLLHVDCHLTVPWYLNVREAHEEIDQLTELIRKKPAPPADSHAELTQAFGESMEFFVHTDPCVEFSCRICTKEDCEVRKHAFETQVEWSLANVISNQKHQSPLDAHHKL